MKIQLTNTMTGNKELFTTRNDEKKISLYVCGITPYSLSHLGHGRVYVTFDILFRLLTFLGYTVTYCRNFTDIDDKLIAKAAELLGDGFRYHEIAEKNIAAYHQEMKQLGCLSPSYEPRVTDHIADIIAFIQELIDNKHAYEVNGNVYFAIDSIEQYPKLSRHKLDNLQVGSRVDVRNEKHNPLDFALWKAEASENFFKSPWGYGRPGWHIECSALARKYLGDHIDIHAGGMDLIFPHHDNEIAQSEAVVGAPFSRFWVHNAFVQVDKEKMSKSLGNVLTLHEIFEHYDPMVLRFYFINHHYRSPLEFSYQKLDMVQKSYERLIKLFADCQSDVVADLDGYMHMPVVKKIIDFLCDDLNTVGALGVIFEHADILQKDQTVCAAVKYIMQQVLGLTLQPLVQKSIAITKEMQALIAEREQARAQKNWARADEIRNVLEQYGIDVHDKKL